jgi:hypothetical protein
MPLCTNAPYPAAIHLCLGGRCPRSCDPLLRKLPLVQPRAKNNSTALGVRLGHLSSRLSKVDLDVAWVALVRVDTTVGSVCATACLGGLVHDDVADDELLSLKALGVCVGLSVAEEREEELGGLHGPSSCDRK